MSPGLCRSGPACVSRSRTSLPSTRPRSWQAAWISFASCRRRSRSAAPGRHGRVAQRGSCRGAVRRWVGCGRRRRPRRTGRRLGDLRPRRFLTLMRAAATGPPPARATRSGRSSNAGAGTPPPWSSSAATGCAWDLALVPLRREGRRGLIKRYSSQSSVGGPPPWAIAPVDSARDAHSASRRASAGRVHISLL